MVIFQLFIQSGRAKNLWAPL